MQQYNLFSEWGKAFARFVDDHNSNVDDMTDTIENNQSHILAEYRPDTYYMAIFGEDFFEKVVGTTEDNTPNMAELLNTLDGLMLDYFIVQTLHFVKQQS